MEKSIDRLLLMSKAAAPSGLVLGIATPTIQPTMAALSPTTTPPVLSQSASTITAPLLTETPIAHSTPIINSPPRPLLQNRRKRSFQDAIAKSAKDQAEANKTQAESSKKLTEAAVLLQLLRQQDPLRKAYAKVLQFHQDSGTRCQVDPSWYAVVVNFRIPAYKGLPPLHVN
ncbi:unnamed protein product [Ceratitis capitata]|uniref:(Mediterranean fruit fly) hypothetical protein n=1 Tax=Ceratitis capitata TaxID=7213 RepID=A0A811US11_CERCA|nr:unnamed protein product [Ceratitis capitata]